MIGRRGIVDKLKALKLGRKERGFTLNKNLLPLGEYEIRR